MFRYVTYTAEEGLGNRLRVHLLAHAFALASGRTMVLDWSVVQACGARFSDLFEVPVGAIEIRHSLHRRIFRLFSRHFGVYLNNRILTDSQTVEELAWVTARVVRLGEAVQPHALDVDGHVLGPFRDAVVEALRPVRAVRECVESSVSQFGEFTVGVHVRHGDFRVCFPDRFVATGVYAGVIGRVLTKVPAAIFYVASDDPEATVALQRQCRCIAQSRSPRVASRQAVDVFGYPEGSNRDTVQGVREGLADMLALARTRLIIGAPGSSFSQMASLFGRVPLLMPSATDEDIDHALSTIRHGVAAVDAPAGS